MRQLAITSAFSASAHILARACPSQPGTRARVFPNIAAAAALHEFPVVDIEQMLEEIERGYVSETG